MVTLKVDAAARLSVDGGEGIAIVPAEGTNGIHEYADAIGLTG